MHDEEPDGPVAVVAPEQAAKEAGLIYVRDDSPGISRRRAGKGFGYRDPQGRPIKDKPTLQRIRKLAMPPAWTDVWICPHPHGHIQATGRDARAASSIAITRAGARSATRRNTTA